MKQKKLVIPLVSTGASLGWIKLVDHEMQTYVPHSGFSFNAETIMEERRITLSFSAAAVWSDTGKPWPETKMTVDKFHKKICGHFAYTDIKIILKRNGIWTHHVEKYL